VYEIVIENVAVVGLAGVAAAEDVANGVGAVFGGDESDCGQAVAAVRLGAYEAGMLGSMNAAKQMAQLACAYVKMRVCAPSRLYHVTACGRQLGL
jgi:hypothetical protein